jgi:hypothetical protein
MMFDLRGKTIVNPFGRKARPLSCLSHDASTKALRKVCGKSMRCHALQTNRKRIETVAGSRSSGNRSWKSLEYETARAKQFHVGSSIETVGLKLEKAGGLQQNRTCFCFKICSFVQCKMTVSLIGPKISWRASNGL